MGEKPLTGKLYSDWKTADFGSPPLPLALGSLFGEVFCSFCGMRKVMNNSYAVDKRFSSSYSAIKSIRICVPTVEGGAVCLQEIGREAARRRILYPPLITHTPPFEKLDQALKNDDWDSVVPILVDSIDRTAKAGAEIVIISANTLYAVFDKWQPRL